MVDICRPLPITADRSQQKAKARNPSHVLVCDGMLDIECHPVAYSHSHRFSTDSDGDGLLDVDEINVYFTDPYIQDRRKHRQ